MNWHSLHCWALTLPFGVAALAPTVQAARSAPPAGKYSPPTSQPSSQLAIPLETLRTTFRNLQKAAALAEAKDTPPGQAAALEQYRKMHQMLQRFPDLKIDPGYKDTLPRKIEDLQAKVTENAQKAAEQERVERAARSAREKAARRNFVGGLSLQGSAGGGGGGGGGGSRGGGSISRGSRGAPACPPGMVRTGST